METKEDRLAIMRWENETGPTPGKNQRSVKPTGERTDNNKEAQIATKSTLAAGKTSTLSRPSKKVLP